MFSNKQKLRTTAALSQSYESSRALTGSDILGHLAELKLVYDQVGTFSKPHQLYEFLLNTEQEYFESNKSNYAHTVHMLHPLFYKNDQSVRKNKTEIFSSTRKHMICPFCTTSLSAESGYMLHILHQSVSCEQCRIVLTMEMLIIASFMKDHGTTAVLNLTNGYRIETDGISFSAFRDYVSRKVKEAVDAQAQRSKTNTRDVLRSSIDSFIKRKLKTMTCFSLDLISAMYTQLDFITKICSNYDYWTNPSVIQACIKRYHKFLFLMNIKKGKMLVPTLDIDLAWHAHQTHPDSYYEFTTGFAGRFVDHDDTVGGEDLAKGYARTFVFWSEVYDEAYSTHEPDHKAWQKHHEISSFILPPIGLYRRIVWKKHGSANGRHVSDLPPQAELVTATATTSSMPVSSAIVISASEVHAVDEEDNDDNGRDEKTLTSANATSNSSNPRSVIGTPVTQSDARPNSYVNDWVLISMYSTPVGGCAGGGCAASGCASAGGCGSGCGGGGCGGGGCGGGGCGGGGCGG